MVAGPIQIHPNEDIKVFNKEQVSDNLYILLLSMMTIICFPNTFICTTICAKTLVLKFKISQPYLSLIMIFQFKITKNFRVINVHKTMIVCGRARSIGPALSGSIKHEWNLGWWSV